MSAPISVVVPTLNAERTLARTLIPLMEGLEAGLIRELIVTDGGSQDATLSVADEAGAVIVEGPASRGGQLRRGVAAARGKWILVMHADTRLSPGWTSAVRAHLKGGQVGYFALSFDATGPGAVLVAGWANLRSWLFGLPYGDQGLLIRRSVYDSVGGYPDQPLMEDVAMARALRGRLVRLNARATTSARRYVETGWLRRGARNLWTLARYLLGADPGHLARTYRK